MSKAPRAMAEPDRTSLPPCPICGRPGVTAFRPFCSARCADVDLNRWLSGSYAIPVAEDEGDDADLPEAPPARRRTDLDPA